MSGRRMRVAHVIEAMHQGGAESLVVEHVRLAAPDVESWVVALNRGGPSLEAAERAGAHAVMLGKGGAAWSGVERLAALLRAERIELVNGHNPTGGLYGALAGARARVPVVFRTEHSIHYAGRHSAWYPALEIVSTLLSRRVVCVCEAVLHSHVSRLPWAAGRFVTVANGISPAPHTRPRESVRAELGADPGAPVALTVGSLTRQKAQHDLLEAWAPIARRLPAAVLWIAGEGPLRDALAVRADALGIAPRVRFLGARRDAHDLIAACDVFVLSSVREGLSITLLEAMRAGRACVATRIGGNGEAVADGVTGRIVPASDPSALSEAIASLLEDPARRDAMGAAGRARWAERFTAERMVRETEALYRAELARARRGAPAPGVASESVAR
jgi:glycosyltransferase involved in cell wall biosynthesis